MRIIVEDETFYGKVLFHGMCKIHAGIFGIKYNRNKDHQVSSEMYGILAPMMDRMVDVLILMCLKRLRRNSGLYFESVVCAIMRTYA